MSVGEPWALSCRFMNSVRITARRILPALPQPHKAIATEGTAAIASLQFI